MRQDAFSVVQLYERGHKERADMKLKKLGEKYSKNFVIFDRVLTQEKHKRGVSF